MTKHNLLPSGLYDVVFKGWEEQVAGTPRKQEIVIIAPISMPDLLYSLAQEDKEKDIDHYQFDIKLLSQVRAITQLSRPPNRVIFIPTGENHRFNLQAQYNLEEEEALKRGREMSEFWRNRPNTQKAWRILEEAGISVHCLRWPTEGELAKPFETVHEAYNSSQAFRYLVDAACAKRTKSTFNRVLYGSEETGYAGTHIESTIDKLKKETPITAQDKENLFNTRIRKLLILYSENRETLFTADELKNTSSEVRKALGRIKAIRGGKKGVTEKKQWENIKETFLTLSRATQNKFMSSCLQYIHHEYAFPPLMRKQAEELGGTDCLSFMTYLNEEAPGWRYAVEHIFKCPIPFIAYEIPSNAKNKALAATQVNLPPVPRQETPQSTPSSPVWWPVKYNPRYTTLSDQIKEICQMRENVTPSLGTDKQEDIIGSLVQTALYAYWLAFKNIESHSYLEKQAVNIAGAKTVIDLAKDILADDTLPKSARKKVEDFFTTLSVNIDQAPAPTTRSNAQGPQTEQPSGPSLQRH